MISTKGSLTQRLTRIALVIAMLVGMGAQHSRSVSAAERTYESDVYGYTVIWDTDVWEVTPSESDGVQIYADGSQGFIKGAERDSEDAESCVAALAEAFEFNNPVLDMRVARDTIERPAFERATGAAELYTFVAPTNDGEFDAVIWFVCLPLDEPGTVLEITITQLYNEYDESIASWEQLLAGVHLPGEELGMADATPDTGGVTTYESADVGYSVSWPADTFKVTENNSETEGFGVTLESEATTAFVSGFPIPFPAADCIVLFAQQLGTLYGELAFASEEINRPEAGPDSASEMFSFIAEDGTTPMVVYLECREWRDGAAFLGMYFVTSEADYETEVEVWQDVLDSIDAE